MAATQKKVVVRTFAATLAWGYLPQGGFAPSTDISLMGVDGRISTLLISEIKTISYVRDFNLGDAHDPERIGRKSFPARPRGDGIWMKLTFRDDDIMEGLATFDLGFVDSLLEDGGIFMRPPDARANTQRVFVPRMALHSLEVLGFVTAPSKRSEARLADPVTLDTQTKLFDE